MKVPGIGEAEAEKIIKNRPYSTRSSLVTRNVLSYDAYMQVKDQLAAENPPQPKPKK
jgi:DNA uptake protein ComE-like DNA-binding protein